MTGNGIKAGMTTIELLLAVALLAVVFSAVATWLKTTSAMCSLAGVDTQWPHHAEVLLQRIHDDVLVGDWDIKIPVPTVTASGALTVPTRVAGAGRTIMLYTLDTEAHAIVASDGNDEHTLQLHQVDSWSPVVDEEERELHITIISMQGHRVRRRIVLP